MGDRYISPELLDKYLSGTCTPDEALQVEAWYHAQENNPDVDQVFPAAGEEQYAHSVFRKISSKITEAESRQPSRSVFRLRSWIWYAAASVAVAATIMWLQQRPAAIVASQKRPVILAALTSLANPTASIELKVLPDGSKVWLNPASRISFGKDYGRSRRQIELEGEAFFEVKRDTTRPFIIRTGKMTTEVLGTSFNVQARTTSRHFEVSVVTGTVAVSGPTDKRIIKARQQVRFDPVSGRLADFAKPSIVPYQLWEPVTINFDWASMKDVTAKLEEMFAVHFEFQNPGMKDCFLRADFTNLRLPVILNLLCESIGASYTIQNNVIRLTGPGC
ncbi:FecR family protein [Dyadobacter sandarakinus]|uniref:FecR family protein n=1 Tax=Dyadobacter sandarakinus TaxID=2747268 RepID=A0ABX7I900_9BACT|nr:FecR family protein [Dyadobacter sandarakinus]QRR02370.1 FecR family protein [Dyadobacter sandarakinus]